MPLERSLSRKEKKERERLALAKRIAITGFDMFLCTNCDQNKRTCVVFDCEGSCQCFECVSHNASCNVDKILVGSWRSLASEEIRLKREKDAALAVHEAAL